MQSSTLNTIAYNIKAAATITPAWNPPPGPKSPWNWTYKPNKIIGVNNTFVQTFKIRLSS